MKTPLIKKLCTAAILTITLGACETPRQDAPEAPTNENTAQVDPETAPAEVKEEEPAPVADDAQMIDKIEQLKETCAKLDEPSHDACETFYTLVLAGDAEARADLDTVLGGSRVADNMVYLEEKVAAMLVEKYGKAE